jgi:hypothetical protein
MAKYDHYLLSNGDSQDFLNVSASVGVNNAVNQPGDVMLVQGLIWILYPEYRGFPDTETAEVTGALDPLTRQAIVKYQSYVKRRNCGLERYNVIADGRVSPAQGKFLFGRGTYTWTIQCLNSDARQQTLRDGYTNPNAYIDQLFEVWPEIQAALHRDPLADSFKDM